MSDKPQTSPLRKMITAAGLLIAFCAFQSDTVLPPPPWETTNAFPELKFDMPVDFTHSNDGTGRLFIVEQRGIVRVFQNNPLTKTAGAFLDIKKKVRYGGEAGMLGLAFHPDFKTNGYYYLNYTRKKSDKLETVITRYKVNNYSDNQTDTTSETILLAFEQPYDNHNGGSIKFGKDGYLYIATGDGGSWGDPHNNAQNKSVLLGKILRIDVNKTDKGNYGIPSDNPFAGNNSGFREEIYALGMRNPWRISFDDATNTLWAGDVGQNSREEIDIIVKGGNYGWRKKESIDCYNPEKDCEEAEFIAPVVDMPQAKGEHSITGGYVYRGTKHPELVGKYIFGDYISGRIFSLETKNGKAVPNQILADRVRQISSFGVDANNELYLCNRESGEILTLRRWK
jgi:glucose/arabinose dehydrogenase